MDGSKIGVLEKTDQICLGRLLEGKDGRTLEAEVGLEVLGDLTNESLEGQLADEQFSALLVSADLSQRDGARSVSVRLLHATSGRCTLARGFGCQLLSWGLASS